MKLAKFSDLPVASKRLLTIGGILALFVALPLFIFALTTQNFELRRKAEVTQTPVPVPITIFETFDGNGEIDLSKINWSGVTGSTVILENNQLKATVPQGADQVNGNDVAISPRINGQLVYPVGDFTASVDLTGVTLNGTGGGFEQIAYGSEGVGIRRHKVGTQETIEVWNQINGSGSLNNKVVSVDLATGSGSIKVKMIKTGDEIQTFYDTGSGDTLLTTLNVPGDLAPRLVVENDPSEYSSVTGYFDNYMLQASIAAPTESPSPSPTTEPTSPPTPTPAPTATPSPMACDTTDINKDGITDIIDYGIFVSDFFKTTPINPRSDVNSDGIVDIVDYSMMVSKFFNTTGACL